MHTRDNVCQKCELTYVIGHETTRLHLWKFATWRFVRRVLNCSSLTLRYIASVIHLTSSHGHLVISHDHRKKGEHRTMRWFERARPHSHIFYYNICYNCPILLLIIIILGEPIRNLYHRLLIIEIILDFLSSFS